MGGLLERVRRRVEGDKYIQALIAMQGLFAKRMRHNDHSKKHVKIVCDHALHIFRLLRRAGIKGDLEKEGLSPEEVETAIFLAAYLHDVGIGVSREHHESFSVCLVKDFLWDVLKEIPNGPRMLVEVLHMIREHRSGGSPLTLEAEIVRLADALDMEKGRAAKEAGMDDMHKISALAIERVKVERGKKRPIRIIVNMKDMSGMFHVIFSLKKKIGPKLEKMVELIVEADGERIALLGTEHGQN